MTTNLWNKQSKIVFERIWSSPTWNAPIWTVPWVVTLIDQPWILKLESLKNILRLYHNCSKSNFKPLCTPLKSRVLLIQQDCFLQDNLSRINSQRGYHNYLTFFASMVCQQIQFHSRQGSWLSFSITTWTFKASWMFSLTIINPSLMNLF